MYKYNDIKSFQKTNTIQKRYYIFLYLKIGINFKGFF